MNSSLPAVTAMAAALLATLCWPADRPELVTDNDRINYSVGYQIGGDFSRQQVELKPQALVQGIEDALQGAQPQMNPGEMRTTLVALKRRIVALQREQAAQEATRNLEASRAFMDGNSNKPGVITLPSGLQYRVVTPGSGATPGPTDTVTVHYRGTLIDGTEFDSSYSRNKPASFGVDQVISGWKEALQLMQPGARWQLFIPPALGYGERGAGSIPANSALVFEVQLLSVGSD